MQNNIQEEKTEVIPAVTDNIDIKNLIYVVRGKQVMVDSDLASLYQVETKRLNESVKRNAARFPESFCFQMTKEEYDSLKSQIATSNANNQGRGGRRKLPYCFTEPGIAMLSAVLHSDTAIEVSIRIMNTFVEMRHFIASNTLLFDKISEIELKQLEYKKSSDEKFEQIFQYIESHAESEQKIFFDGQIYDAFSLLTSIIKKAKKEIVLIDGYVDIDTLNILIKKNSAVDVKIYTFPNAKLTNKDIENFNAQYPTLDVKKTKAFHDRFIIIDGKNVYHVGASIKDAGRKCFGITLIKDIKLVKELLNRLKTI